jgi:excisionase family DNA binding protein
MSKLLEGSTEIRNRLGVSESTFMDLVLKHGLPARKGGSGVYKITESDLDKWEKNRGRSKDFYVKAEPEKKPDTAPKGKRGKSFRNKN